MTVNANESTPDINIPFGLLRVRRGTTGGGNSGNNSDNSGTISIGNNSFGFNFDSDEMNKIGGEENERNSPPFTTVNSGNNANRDCKNDSNGRGSKEQAVKLAQEQEKQATVVSESSSSSSHNLSTSIQDEQKGRQICVSRDQKERQDDYRKGASMISSLSSAPGSSGSNERATLNSTHSLSTGAPPPTSQTSQELTSQELTSRSKKSKGHDGQKKPPARKGTSVKIPVPSQNRKHTAANGKRKNHPKNDKMDETDVGCSSDNEDQLATSQTPEVVTSSQGKVKQEHNHKREERNAREKDRSYRISMQIDELRCLLSNGGVIVPKGTKSSVLTEAASYIRMLQQHQYRSEINRYQLVQQIQMIGSGALGPLAASAVRHAAAQNGVWCLGNFGGVPPQSAMTYPQAIFSQQAQEAIQISKVEEHEYRHIYNSCPAAIAIASMGGAFIDCNKLFCQLSEYTKQELCAMTIFNITARSDLQNAFDMISSMISPPTDGKRVDERPGPINLRGSMKQREDLGISVALIKGDNGVVKCFCVTLLKSIPPPFSSAPPIIATPECLQPKQMSVSQPVVSKQPVKKQAPPVLSPTFTAG